MCNYFSCIATRDLKIVWDRYETSHEELIEKAGLEDNKLEDRGFVRLELVPKPKTILSSRLEDWDYRIDEKGSVPEWYSKNEEKIKEKVWAACQRSITPYKKNVGAVNEFIVSLKDIKWFSFSGKISKSWHVSFGVDICAARDAAEDAAEDAAGDAAWNAAWNAAEDAAEDAAGDAARAAAWNAARDAALYARCLLAKDKIAKKHFKHAEERMKVWKAGFGLRCDVNGKLYVYAVKKAKKVKE